MELTQFDWLRIRSALLSAVNDLADASSDQEQQYAETYKAVKVGLAAMYANGLGWQPSNTTTTTT
jgi:outer membrane protein TolC